MRGIDAVRSYDTVLVRVDLNSPVEDGVVQDNQRFARYATTIQTLADRGHAVICLAHQGRPNQPSFVPLEQHAAILGNYLDDASVQYVDSVAGSAALDAISNASGGDVVLLENTRMHPDELPERPIEEHAASDLVQTLSTAVDAYVNDGFSVAHRSHASVVGFPSQLPSAAGPVMLDEYEAATKLRSQSFDGDVVLLCGGVKADDVLHVARNVDDVVDTFLVAGVLGELLLRADGYPVGTSVNGDAPYDELWADHERSMRSFLHRRRDDIVLPVDLAGGEDERIEERVSAISRKTHPYYDIGEQTVERFSEVIDDAAAVFMKGAPGVFEDEWFDTGTIGVLTALEKTDAYTVIGGGDTARALSLHGFDEASFSHVSIAGGAYIRALTGEELPAVTALRNGEH